MLPLPLIAAIARKRTRAGILYSFSPNDVLLTRATPATYLDANGLVQSVAAGVLRRDHWPYGRQTTLTEPSAINRALHNRDLTNAVWVRTNMSATRDQVGADGVANRGTLLTATAPNATILQSVTLASSSRVFSARVRRVTGTGTVEMTTDNGATWTPIVLTGSYQRFSVGPQTVTDPVFGFRIVTSGDAIVVDFTQNENGPWATSDIETAAAAVTRNADVAYIDLAQLAPPRSLTVYIRSYNVGQYVSTGAVRRILHLGSTTVSADAKLSFGGGSGGATAAFAEYDDGPTSRVATATASPSPATLGTIVEQRATLNTDWTVTSGVAVSGGSEVSATSLASAQASAWAANRIYLAGSLSGENAPCASTHILVADGSRTIAQLRQLAGV